MQTSPLLIGSLLLLSSCATRPGSYDDRLAAWDRLDRLANSGQAPSGTEQALLREGSGLDQLLMTARVQSPKLRAAFERWKAALEAVPNASGLPNPKLTLQSYLSAVETRVGPIRGSIGIAQSFPWFGKRSLAGDVAFQASEVAREMLEAERLDLDQLVRDTWYEYAFVQQAIIITEGNRDLLLHSESVANVRMATGLGSHTDVIRAQVELGKLEDRVATMVDLQRPLIARINAALDRPSAASIPIPQFPLAVDFALQPVDYLEKLAQTSPRLRALGHRVAMADAGVKLADRAYYPDFFIGLDYTLVGSARSPGVSGSGDDAISLKLGVDLPIWRGRYDAQARAKNAQARAARLEAAAALNSLRADLEMALYRYRDADRRVELFGDTLVPKGEESVEALDTAYQAGEDGFLDLIDSQRVLLEFQLQWARAISDRAQAQSTIEQISGIQLQGDN